MPAFQSARGLALALGLTWACAGFAQTFRYTVTQIPPLPGYGAVFPRAINNRGEVVGSCSGAAPSTVNHVPFVYRPGTGTQPLPLPAGLAYGMATDINDDGVIVGYAQPSFTSVSPLVAWEYEAGVLTTLPSPSYANSINNSGVMVGRACLSGTQLTCYFRVVPGGAMENVGTGNHYYETTWRLVDINDSGQILYTFGANGPGHRREPDGSITPLPTPVAPYTRTTTFGINNAGECIANWGYNIGSLFLSQAFVWSPATGRIVVGPSGFGSTRARGINNLGHVVGEAGPQDNAYSSAWIWTPQRGSEELLPLVDPSAGLADINAVFGINDRGQIIADAITTSGRSTWIILNPVVPPCRADWNGDGVVDFNDLLAYLNDFNAGNSRADLNGDGIVDFNDLLEFLNLYNQPC